MSSTANTDDSVSVEVYAAESPTYADVPFWLTACVRLAPPVGRTKKPSPAVDKVFPVVQAALADRMRVDQEDVGLDRELISLIAGYQTAKEGRWLINYLQHIGFLRVRKNYEPGSGKRYPDTFIASTRPPLGYVGPMNYAELANALRSSDPADRVLFVDADDVPRSEPRDAQASVGPEAYGRPGVSRGQIARSEPRDAQASVGPEAYGRPGVSRGQIARSEPRDAQAELADGVDGEMERTPSGFSPSRSIDQTHTADASAAASDDALAAARKLVQRLPWQGKGHRLSVANADKLTRAIASAVTDHGLTMAQAEQHALTKLAESTSPGGAASFVIDGFKPGNLYEPLAAEGEQLSLPVVASVGDRVEQASMTSAGTPNLHPVAEPVARPACEVCGAEEGADLAVRMVEDPATGNVAKCACRAHVA